MKKYDYYVSVGQFILWVLLQVCATIEAIAQTIMCINNDWATSDKIIFSLLCVALVASAASLGNITYKEMKQAKQAYKDSRLADSIKLNRTF